MTSHHANTDKALIRPLSSSLPPPPVKSSPFQVPSLQSFQNLQNIRGPGFPTSEAAQGHGHGRSLENGSTAFFSMRRAATAVLPILPHNSASMSSRRLDLALAGLARRPLTCLFCQARRSFTSSTVRAARTEKPGAGASLDPQATVAGTPIEAPRSYGKRFKGEFVPKPLPRPIGLPLPPKSGENTGIDVRSLKQRKEDFVNYDKHLERRKELTAKISRPYFRDWGNLSFHEGKSFIAPPRLFKAELSLFFPNLYGETLLKTDRNPRDTTPALTGKASIVSIFSSRWAEQQVETFIGKKENPELHQVLAQTDELSQLVHLNYEDNAGKAWLVRFFMSSLRRQFPEKDWDKYFLVRRGITDHIRESIGFLNSKVGYVYLVDQHCRIRWAGSGPAHPVEQEGLARGLARLVDEINREATLPATAREQPPGKPHLEKKGV